ncbi:Uncharacterised protein [Citrobacter koseri]|nr:Uncharacterised protein [Citrobacter koseri]
MPGRLFQRGDADACQLCPFQFVKTEQADVAAPVKTNAFERTGNLQCERAVSGDHGFAHPPVLLVKLAQGVIQLRIFRQRHLGVFRHHARVTRQRRTKCVQALAAGIDHTERFAEKQDRLEPLLNEMFGGGCCRLGVIQTDDIAGEIRDFTVNQNHRQRRLLQAVQPLLAHPDGVHHDAFHLVATQQIQIVQFLIHLIVGVTDQGSEPFLAAGGFNAAQHVNGIGVGNIGDDQANQAGTAAFQASGHQAWAIVEFGNGFFNARQQGLGQQMLLTVEVA